MAREGIRKVPVLVMGFNRPEFVRMALESVRTYQPDKLYLACDGARDEIPGELKLVTNTQQAMLDAVDWDCEINTLFRVKNLGCDKSIYEAISWFFEQEDYGIIIEDDVIISLDFFKLCEILLPKYQSNENILQIGAFNPFVNNKMSNTYSFGKRPMTWGWATWNRCWLRYMDKEMKRWPYINKWNIVSLYGLLRGVYMWRNWAYIYRHQEDKNNPWDTYWHFAAFANNLISICPLVNLSKNIGNTSNGTHYQKGDKDPYERLEIGEMRFPLMHPEIIELDINQVKADNKDFWRVRRYGLMKKISRLF